MRGAAGAAAAGLTLAAIGQLSSAAAVPAPAAANWPGFRGPAASGVADGMALPEAWDGGELKNMRWKVRIPGLAHSSPVVWGGKVLLTSAVSSAGEQSIKHGLYGSGEASGDRSPQRWIVLCLDAATGEVLWERTAFEGVPRDRRHIKATYANATPATDGEVVVAFFGSQGVAAYDLDGKLLWTRDLGRLDTGAYDAPDYEWGPASSPLIDGDRVIFQCDTQGEDFITALDRTTGQTLWRTSREELPSWGTPAIYSGSAGRELVANGSRFIRGYNPATGEELWRLGGSSEITAPTPVMAGDLIIVASGRRPERPIFAVKAGARGDITLPEGATAGPGVAWSKTGAGPYMPTPLVYGDHLYILQNQGILDCYDLATGKEIYRERIPHSGGGFSASPVAADGRIYLPAEDGDIFVVRAGPEFAILGRNDMGEVLMATPALAGGTMFVRGQEHLFAVAAASP